MFYALGLFSGKELTRPNNYALEKPKSTDSPIAQIARNKMSSSTSLLKNSKRTISNISIKRQTLPNGNLYIGQAKEMGGRWIAHGEGKEYLPDGEQLVFSGSYKKGARQIGELYEENQQVAFKGNFDGDRPVTGIYYHKDGTITVSTMDSLD